MISPPKINMSGIKGSGEVKKIIQGVLRDFNLLPKMPKVLFANKVPSKISIKNCKIFVLFKIKLFAGESLPNLDMGSFSSPERRLNAFAPSYF